MHNHTSLTRKVKLDEKKAYRLKHELVCAIVRYNGAVTQTRVHDFSNQMASALPTPLLMFLLALMLTIMLISSMARSPSLQTAAFAPPSTLDGDGRMLGARGRRRRRAAAVEEAARVTAAPPPPPVNNVTTVTDPRCHAAEHTGYAGDGAVVWGLGKPGFHLKDAATCCRACMAHNEICGKPNARGSKWWPERPDMHCGGDPTVACTIWTFCPEERCFAFDIHKHEFGECWLKFQKGDDPPYTRPKDPHFGHKVYPEVMRHAPRKIWPWGACVRRPPAKALHATHRPAACTCHVPCHVPSPVGFACLARPPS